MIVILMALCFGDVITKVSNPIEVQQEISKNSNVDIQGKIWNRWTSKNFTVCSIHDGQAQYLQENLEQVKTWILTRWGMPDVDLSSECRLICVDDKDLYKKLFGLTESKVEIRRDKNGKINLSVIFLLLNDKPSKTIPIPLTEVCIAELEQQYDVKLNLCSRRGISLLNGTLGDIRNNVLLLYTMVKNNNEIYFSKGLLTFDAAKYNKETVENRITYDCCAMVFCLMLRKEFGEDKFIQFLRSPNPETALLEVYGFSSLDQFDNAFKQYIMDIGQDISNEKTPNEYLQITPKGQK